MAENMLAHPSTSSTRISLPDFPMKSHSAKKISSLYEIEYLSEKDKVQPTDLPTVNPNAAYRSFTRADCYSRDSSRIFSRMKTCRYLEYQNACIATIEATLNSGLVMVTLFPNFTMALVDPNLTKALKVQIQIARAPQVASAITATLHYQIVYMIQDHVFNLSMHETDDLYSSRQIPKRELIKLLPDKWITSYEKLHEHSQPIQSTSSQIMSKGDGTTEIKFDHSHLHSFQNPNIFPTQLMMQPNEKPAQFHDQEDPDCCCPLCESGPERSLIESFSADGKPLYMFKDPVTGHGPWALNCSCELCTDDRLAAWIDCMDITASKPGKRKKKKNLTQDEFYKIWINRDPDIGPLGEDNGKYVYLVDYSSHKSLPNTKVLPEPCKPPSPPPPKSSTQSPANTSKKSKPFLQPCYKKINKWVKKNPDFLAPQKPISTTDISDAPTKITAAEATLNWQTENAIAQNHVLKRIDSKISNVETKIDDNTKMVRDLIQQPAAPGQDFFSHLAQREKEIQKLKDQIKTLQETGKIPEPTHRAETIELFPSIRQKNPLPAEGVRITFPEVPKCTKPILEESPPRSPPSKQVSKSLMIQEEDQNPLTKFLKDYTKSTIPKISTVQNPESSTEADSGKSSKSSEESEFSSDK
ncbi:hypothetical protein PVK06_029071 [Gossypium arboreum]|uniref:Uncharacterized protein n=1 Tax=Gossypium arboreum TaxID=29729 RepID=A0ABR0P5N2_GOSAR|nr:hypothetical protein PVK06_029071 [Gossypium arboreum]